VRVDFKQKDTNAMLIQIRQQCSVFESRFLKPWIEGSMAKKCGSLVFTNISSTKLSGLALMGFNAYPGPRLSDVGLASLCFKSKNRKNKHTYGILTQVRVVEVMPI